jgi:hypothetical protein
MVVKSPFQSNDCADKQSTPDLAALHRLAALTPGSQPVSDGGFDFPCPIHENCTAHAVLATPLLLYCDEGTDDSLEFIERLNLSAHVLDNEPGAETARAQEAREPQQTASTHTYNNRRKLKDDTVNEIRADVKRAYELVLQQSLQTLPGKKDLFAFCPFHNDRNHPNLRINIIKGLCFCDACGAGGDLFALAARLNNCESDFESTLRWVAELLSLASSHGNGTRGSANQKTPKSPHVHGPVFQTIRYEMRDFAG